MFDTAAMDKLVRNNRNRKEFIGIIDIRPIGSAFDISATTAKTFDVNDFAAAFRDQMKGAATLIEGTYRTISRTPISTFHRFVAKPGRVSKPFIETASMTNLGDGKYADNASNIWTVTGEGEDARIVMQHDSDVGELLSLYKARVGVNDALLAKPFSPRRADFAGYIGADYKISHGIVHSIQDGKVILASLTSNHFESVDSAQIINCFDPANMPNGRKASMNLDISNTNKSQLKEFFDYLARVYPPEYIRALKAKVGQ